MNLSDLLKTLLTVDVKIVPDAKPDAEGRWTTLTVAENRVRPRTHWNYLSSLVPQGFHVVAVRNAR
jgi:hypothetical protein